jgi:hypothetical protein
MQYYYNKGFAIHSAYTARYSISNYIWCNTKLYRIFNTTFGANWCALYCAMWLHAIITPFIILRAIIKHHNVIHAIKQYYNGVLACADD